MENPFETGHIKNYILFYIGIVLIMILFFIASSLFNDIKTVDKRKFDTNITKQNDSTLQKNKINNTNLKFKLLPNAY